MKTFVDVSLFLDTLTKRAELKQSFRILASVKDERNEVYISALSPAIVYFLRREVKQRIGINCLFSSHGYL